MITIPEYVYKDATIEFVCPSLEVSRDKAARMRAVLTDPNWPDVLNEMKYICYAFKRLGVTTAAISNALALMHNCISLDGCIKDELPGYETLKERVRVANLIRKAWCRHMRDHLEETLKQG